MNTRRFSDIDLSFNPHPSTGDLLAKYDDNAIKNSLKNLLLTKHYERPFHSEIGSSINSMMFELPSAGIVAILNQEIRNTIANFEPRVVVLDVSVTFSPDDHLFVSVIFRIVNTERPITLQFTLNRTR
jgi:phage baseplate assembly protein W